MQDENILTEERISVKNNLWALWSFIGGAFISFLYVGIKVRNNKWLAFGILYLFIVSIFIFMFVNNISFGKWRNVFVVLWTASVMHSLSIRMAFQKQKFFLQPNSLKELSEIKNQMYFNHSIQLWKECFPENYNDIDSKYNILNGILAVMMAKIDGVITKEEFNLLNIDLLERLNMNIKQIEEFEVGAHYATKKTITNDELRMLQVTLDDDDRNINTIEMLIAISAIDGFLDKSEYNFIKMISFNFGKNLPDFKELAIEQGTNTSNTQRDENVRKIRQASINVGNTAILGVGCVAAGVILLLLEGGPTAQKNNARSSKKPTSSSQKPSILSGSDKVIGKNQKVCGNCQYWTGVRKIDRSQKTQLLIPCDQINNGQCGNTKYSRNGQTVQAMMSGCPSHKMWGNFS